MALGSLGQVSYDHRYVEQLRSHDLAEAFAERWQLLKLLCTALSLHASHRPEAVHAGIHKKLPQ